VKDLELKRLKSFLYEKKKKKPTPKKQKEHDKVI
jgi:hypothetical protein